MLGVPAASRPFRRLRKSLIGLQIALLLFTLVAPAGTLFAATIQTDLWVYQHGDTVTVTGTEFGPDETVAVVTTDPAGTEVDRGTVQAAPDGSFTYQFILVLTSGGVYDVVGTGLTSGLSATTQFDPAFATLSTTSIAFGSVSIGSTAGPTTVVVTNTGTTNLNVQNIVLSGATTQFSLVTPSLPQNGIPPGGTTSFNVSFSPTSSGIKNATVSLTTNANNPTVSLTGTGVVADQPPVAIADSATVVEDSGANTIDVLANDTDVDGGPKSVDSVGAASHGTTAITGGGTGVSFAPAANSCGSDSFTYTLNGGSTATVSVTVTCVDDAPVAVDDAATAGEDSGANGIDVLANDTDIDGGPKSVASVGSAGHGATAVTGGGTGVSYTPASDFCGSDAFTYTLNGGSTATVSVGVTCADDPPVAVDDAATVGEDSGANAIDVLANDTDVDAGPKSVASVGSAGHGATAITGGGTGLSYAPAANFCASDSFTYTLNGGSTATVSVTVTCVDDAPVAVGDSATVDEDSGANTIDVLANDTDIDGGPRSVASVGSAGHGTTAVTGGGAGVSYSPAADFCGSDSFTYTLNGGSTATVSVSITCLADAPVAVDDSATTAEDQGVDIDVTANDTDADGDTLTVDGFDATSANGGIVVLNADGTLRYLPAADFFGVDTFTYTVSDGGLGSNAATVTVTVTPVNDAPVANDDTTTTDEDAAVDVDVLANDTDVDNTAADLSVDSYSQGAHGSVALDVDGSLVYTPSANYNGPDSFTYVITDGDRFSAVATVSITVAPVNDPPVLDAIGNRSTDEEALLAFTATASDVDGDGLTFSLGGSVPAGASITAGGLFSWTPTEAQGPGSYTFDVVVSDGVLQDSETITVTVDEVNVAPELAPIGGQVVEEGSELTFTASATDHDVPANGLTFSLAGAPAGATIDPSTGAFSWTASDDAVVSFTVVVTDDGSPAMLDSELITVTVENAPPTALLSGPTDVDEGLSGTYTITTTDPGDDTFVLVDASCGVLGVLSWIHDFDPADGSGTFSCAFADDDPSGTLADPSTVSIEVDDDDGGQSFDSRLVLVHNVDPVANAGDDQTVNEGDLVSVLGTQTDQGPNDTFPGHVWQVVASNGQTVPDGGASAFSFTPYDNGTYALTYGVSDDDGGSGSDSLVVTVLNVAPTVIMTGDSATSPEGTAISLGSAASDVSSADVAAGFTYAWSVTKNGSPYDSGTLDSFSFTPDDNGTYLVTLTATDKDGGTSTPATKTIAVTNVAPTAALGNSGPILEGGSATLSFSGAFDPSSIDTSAGLHYAFSCTGGSLAGATWAGSSAIASTACPFTDNGTFTVRGRVIDKDGGFTEATTNVTVTNVAPTASITGAPSTSPEGTAISLGSIVTDPSSVDQAAGFTYAWSVTKNAGAYASGSTSTFSFTPDDNGTYVVSLTATDKDGGVGTALQQTINVTNVNPVVGTITLTGNDGTACLAGSSVALRFTFGDAGTVDNTWVVDIDWGDGSPHGSANLTSQTGTFGPYAHTYLAGSFTPTVKITDKDGGVGSATSTATVSLLYATSGFLQPINIAGQRSSFKIGSTIPVKLQATDCTGASVPGLVLSVHLAKIDPSAESVNEIVSSSAADTGTTMRYDSAGRQYIFNLSTKNSQFNLGQDLTTGTYHVWVTGASIQQVDATFDARK